jgi:predicted NUDIX family NTP pyrophosphohydrolase
MAASIAAGLLMCRQSSGDIEYFLVHPGGPFFKNKNEGFWTIPKGLPETAEDLLIAAQREFNEETGIHSTPPFHPLGTVKQKGGKIVHAWSFLGDWNPTDGIIANTFKMEWPPRSGKFQEFPEQDRAEWMNYERAIQFIVPEQIPFLDRARKIHQ